MDPPQKDWQTSCRSVQDRIEHMLKTGISSDCKFMVGSGPNRQEFNVHKFMLVMASPVFDTMFNGSLPEKDEIIQILDVQPATFQTLLEYIYLDKLNIESVDEAYKLSYIAKKYMLPYIYDRCITFLAQDLFYFTNACQTYEFALLFEENQLAKRCFELIRLETERIIALPNFEETNFTTLQVILDEDSLNIANELTLFLALARFADKYKHRRDEDDRLNDPCELPPSIPTIEDCKPVQRTPTRSDIIEALKKIRFLCFTPQQFAEHVPQTNLLNESELLSILMNICSPRKVIYPMPDGFSTTLVKRTYVGVNHKRRTLP